MPKIKICGLMRIEDIFAVNEAKPDYIGFVLAESRRRLTFEQAYFLKNELDVDIEAVGVFVDASIEEVVKYLSEGVIDIPQLHGNESEAYIQKLKAAYPCKVIKAIQVHTSEDIKKAQELSADYLLLDQGKGGTGQSFDWSLIEPCEKPFFLAGGIQLDNLALALEKVNPYAVDLSSGVETDGQKDKDKIVEIVRRVKHGER